MKRVVLIVMAFFFGVTNVVAQQSDSVKFETFNARIDSLQTKLDKLQANYDYLSCEYEITKLDNQLNIFANELSIKSNSMLINCYHSRFDVDLYISYKDNYDACNDYLDVLKSSVLKVQQLVFVKIMNLNFTEQERDLLSHKSASFDLAIRKLEKSLEYYKMTIDIYKKNR